MLKPKPYFGSCPILSQIIEIIKMTDLHCHELTSEDRKEFKNIPIVILSSATHFIMHKNAVVFIGDKYSMLGFLRNCKPLQDNKEQ